MANSLRQSLTNGAGVHRSWMRLRWLSSASDALVELKPGEVGMISGIPEEHLRRRVYIYTLFFSLWLVSYTFFIVVAFKIMVLYFFNLI